MIVLSCGHFFTVETVDGIMGIDLFYSRHESGEFADLRDIKYIEFSELEQLSCACPNCRTPISIWPRKQYVHRAMGLAQACSEMR